MWTALVVTLVFVAPPPKDAPARSEDDRELQVLARGVWPVRQTRPAQFVIRDAEQLALLHEIDDKNAKDARFQTDVTADIAQLLKVQTIDWKKHMLVVVAAGAKPTGGYRVEILTLAVKDRTLLVQWKLNSPNPDSTVRQARTYPAQMVLIEQFAGPVKFDPPVKDK
jgi:hypothetical protein